MKMKVLVMYEQIIVIQYGNIKLFYYNFDCIDLCINQFDYELIDVYLNVL